MYAVNGPFNPALFVNKVGTKSESWDVAPGLLDLKTPSSDLCPVTTIYVGKIPVPTGFNASSILALGLLGVFPRLEEILSEDDHWRWCSVNIFRSRCRRRVARGWNLCPGPRLIRYMGVCLTTFEAV